VQQLTGLDAGFLYMETPTLHMHTLKIAVLDPTTSPGGYSFERVKEELEKRLHLLPPFRRRLVDVPLGLHHPVWIEDPDFDLDWHLHNIAVLAPGDQRQFCQLISDIASRQLDRSRPLWEIWVVEGLAGDRVGFVAKIHHSVADGVAAAALLANVLDPDPMPHDPPPPERPWRPDTVPTSRQLLWMALRSLLGVMRSLPGLLKSTVAGMRGARRVRQRNPSVSPPLPLATVSTRFNGSLTPHRMFSTAQLPLDEVKGVSKAFGVTVNDVVLGLCAGALRRYLEERGELPSRPLVAGVPVAVAAGGEGERRLGGNWVSNMFTSLRTDLADPVERLKAIHETTKVAKEVHHAMGAEMLAAWSELTPPRPFAAWMRFYSRRKLADWHRPPINLVVSNVPGPQAPLYIAGARLVELYSMGPVLEGVGLNITVWSYVGVLYFGVVACRETMPDLSVVCDYLGDALSELSAQQTRR
jgi:diacylglycerol O-acyltransferase